MIHVIVSVILVVMGTIIFIGLFGNAAEAMKYNHHGPIQEAEEREFSSETARQRSERCRHHKNWWVFSGVFVGWAIFFVFLVAYLVWNAR